VPPTSPINQNNFQVEVFNGDGRSLGIGRAHFTVMARPGVRESITVRPRLWKVRVTNLSGSDASVIIHVAYYGTRPLIERPIDLDFINHKLNILFNDVQPIRMLLRNRDVLIRPPNSSQTIRVKVTDLVLELHPEWALVHRDLLGDDPNLPGVHHTFSPGFMDKTLSSSTLRLTAEVVENRPAIHVSVYFNKSKVDLGDLVQALVDKTGEALADFLPAVELPDFTINLYFVLRNHPEPGSVIKLVPSFDVRVRVEVGGSQSSMAMFLRAGLELALNKIFTKFSTEKILHKYAQTFLGWVLGDREALYQGTRATVALNQVGDAPTGPVLVSDFGSEPQPPLDPGNLSKIDHVVVVMMENRSFDHMLGYLSLPASGNDGRVGRGRLDVDGLTGAESNPFEVRGGRVRVFPQANTRIEQDPAHSFDAALKQRGDFTIEYSTAGGSVPRPPPGVDEDEWLDRYNEAHRREFYVRRNEGFVLEHLRKLRAAYPNLSGAAFTTARDAVMSYYTAAQLPTYDYLAQNFGICDRWFSAHPGHTWPNRFISLTGGLILGPDNKPQYDNPSLSTFEPLQLNTIFDHLTAAGVEWRCYEHNFCFLRLFKKYTTDRTRVRQYLAAPLLGEQGFAADVQSRNWMTTPSVTFIEPRIIDISPANANDDHPPADVGNGQRLIKEVIDALQAQPEVWAKTLLLVTYDEAGGFFDHVHASAGAATPMFSDPYTGVPVTYRGFRVPAFVATPFVPARTVSHEVYDHTSILKTIMARFLAAKPPNMGPRVAAARDVGSMLSLNQPRPLTGPLPVVAFVRKKTTRLTALPSDDFRRFLTGFRDKFVPAVVAPRPMKPVTRTKRAKPAKSTKRTKPAKAR